MITTISHYLKFYGITELRTFLIVYITMTSLFYKFVLLLSPLPTSPPPHPLLSDDHQFVLCDYESASVWGFLFICSIF